MDPVILKAVYVGLVLATLAGFAVWRRWPFALTYILVFGTGATLGGAFSAQVALWVVLA